MTNVNDEFESRYGISKEENIENFKKKALLTKKEVIYFLDNWIERAKTGDFEIAISETGKEELVHSLTVMRDRLIRLQLDDITEPLKSYTVDIFDDCIQFGIIDRSDCGGYFDDNGDFVPEYPEEVDEEEAEENSDSDDKNSGAESTEKQEEQEEQDEEVQSAYTHLVSVPVKMLTIDEWAETNNVKPATAYTWAGRERIKTYKRGRNVFVSAIQYVPDALYANDKRTVRFKAPGYLPEDIVDRFPYLAGEVFDILFVPPSAENPKAYRIFIISRINGESPLGAKTMEVTLKERKALLNTLLRVDGLKSVFEKYYHSPLGECYYKGKGRFTKVKYSGKKYNSLYNYMVSATLRNSWVGNAHSPEFWLKLIDANDTKLCFVNGTLVTTEGTVEERLLKAIFGVDDYETLKNRALYAAGVDLGKSYPWDRNVVLVTSLGLQDESRPEVLDAVLCSLKKLVKESFAFAATAVVFAIKKDSTNYDEQIAAIKAAGYTEVVYEEDEGNGEDDETTATQSSTAAVEQSAKDSAELEEATGETEEETDSELNKYKDYTLFYGYVD